MPTLFLTTEAEMIANLQAIINLEAGQSPPKKPTWTQAWATIMAGARSVTLNVWDCVKNRRWLSGDEIGSESASDLVALLTSDIGACEEPPYTILWVSGGDD